MLHPSYTDLIRIVNAESEGDTPVVNSRYSIVMAAAKRARQIVSGKAIVTEEEAFKPLSTAVRELAEGSVTILPEEDTEEDEHTPDLTAAPARETMTDAAGDVTEADAEAQAETLGADEGAAEIHSETVQTDAADQETAQTETAGMDMQAEGD